MAEQTSIGLSALGTIAAAVTQQTVYAATPLTIALSLNFFNRQEELKKQTFRLDNQKAEFSYELIFDRSGSRQVLIEALENAEKRLILVCPWMTNYAIDYTIINLCRNFAYRGGILDIGWGHLSDTQANQHSRIGEAQFLQIVEQNRRSNMYLYGLNRIRELQIDYPNKINLKLLGTHEKFLVCDNKFAMLGSHNFLTSNANSPEREIGLKTNDPKIIKGLIERFDNGVNLEL